jgi:RNA methyltransferase, TrmH family
MADRETGVITSRRNERVVELRKLDQRKHRMHQGRFRVEGLQLLHMALDSRARPLEVFYCESQLVGREAPQLLRRFRQAGAQMVEVSPDVLQSISEREVCQGIIATFPLAQQDCGSLSLIADDLVVVLDRLQDPGNVGTLIRTADAVGAAAVVLIEPCADPYDPKTVRGSMGSLFNVPLVQVADLPGLFACLRGKGLRVTGADAQLGAAWGEGILAGGTALVLGNEARGISDDVRDYVRDWARLPIVGKAESLNVAVAGGVLMYEWLRTNLRRKRDRGE